MQKQKEKQTVKRELIFENPEITVVRLENQEDVIRTSQIIDENDDKQWTGFY